MADKLINGDYKKDAQTGKELTVEYITELLQNALVTLTVRRGKFYPDKNFGSGIRENAALPAEEYIFAFAVQALDGIDGLTVKSARVGSEGEAVIALIINDKENEVKVKLESNV